MINTNELINLMRCPSCESSLESLSSCSQCGTKFVINDNTPVIIPKSIHKKVEIEYSSSYSVDTIEFNDCFQYPPIRGASPKNMPYHLDLAHSTIIESFSNTVVILEVGCGGGQMRQYIESLKHQYIGIDISKTRVQKYLQEYGGPDILCDAHVLPFKDQTFDVVYSVAVAEHLTCPYFVVKEIARVLKPGGFYLGSVSFLEPWHDNSFFHMTPLGVFELLTQSDFDVTYIWPGENYSGFKSLMDMSNKTIKSIKFIGNGLDLLYKKANQLRTIIKRDEQNKLGYIHDNSKVAGAIGWIAKRPFSA